MVTVVDRVPTVQVSSAAGINRSVDLSVASGKDVQVAAFLTWRLRHFQKQVSIEEQLKRSGSRVQVELKFEHPGPWKSGGFGSPHWNAVTGVPRSRVRISPAPPLYPAVTHPDMAPRSRHFRKSPFPTRKWRERFSPRSTARFLCRCSLQIGDREGQRRLPRCSLRDVDVAGETRIEGHYVLCAGHFRAEGYGISRNRVAYPA